MIKTVYKASDGKEFNSIEDCKEYEDLPRVYILSELTGYHKEREKAFLSEKEAKSYKNTMNSLHEDSFMIFWSINIIVLELPKNREETTQIIKNPVSRNWWSKYFG